ncbi:MAG: tetratricopeptide repeat protein, partial [bacterium]|nr:tetratricopeptide repeat protein [bacterium]
ARRLRHSLAGDVDAIVLKALRKEPRHRYASVEQLAEDVRRHLEGLPVLARRGTWTYRARKFVRRRRWGIAAALVVVGLSLTSTVLWRRAEHEHIRADRERAEAVRERTRAERVSEFLQDLFKSANPDAAQGGTLTVREILDQGRDRLATGLEDEPELRAELAGTLGDVYRNLGLYDEALELLEDSLRIRRRRHPEGHPDLVVDLNDLASVYYYVG